MKITRLNINALMETNKFLVLAIVEESKVQEIPDHMKEYVVVFSFADIKWNFVFHTDFNFRFKNMVESVIKNYRDRFHR